MQKTMWLSIIVLCFVGITSPETSAEDLSTKVRKAVEKSTLDQPGTKPFHLKATYAPSLERDKDSRRTGEVEIWWKSPTQWRREVRSPEFHQVAIMDGAHEWQKNDGDYFPEWLRELAVALVRPVPLSFDVLAERVKSAEVKSLMGQTNVNWDPTTAFDNEQANGGGNLALDKNCTLLYTGGPGWGGLYHDFADFHGRSIGRTVASGYIETTTKITILEDLGSTSDGFFDATLTGGDAQLIDTVVLSQDELAKQTLPGTSFDWPPVTDAPFEGVVWTSVLLDRTGKIREMIPPIADNPAMRDAAEKGFRSMQFKPFLHNGVPVQATGIIRVHFKTGRPAGMENFDTAKAYFELGRKASFLAAGSTSPYLLHAEFQIGTKNGVQTGRYEDTWISATEWKREAWFGSSHLVKSRSDDKYYVLAEGAEPPILRLVMQLLEPIPAEDTMTESDWRIRRDTLNGVDAIRVYRGPEGPKGELDPRQSQVFWFDQSGHLIKCFTSGFEIRPSDAQVYNGVQVARRIDVLKGGQIGLRIDVKTIGPADPSAAKSFKLKGHEWQRAFTAEVR
jgi:hypothetical protein